MTDPSGLTPEQDAVRRLLADARHDGSTPPEVVARLDEALASLVSERVSERVSEPVSERERAPRATSAPVVDLGTRRRRTVGIGLLAAAAVVVAGVAIGQGLPRMEGSDGGSADSASAGDSSLAESDDSGGAGSQYDNGGAEEGPQSLKSTTTAPQAAGLPTLSSTDADLDDDLLDLRSSAADGSERSEVAGALSGCHLRGIGRGRQVVAQVDGQVGIVVFRRPDGAAQPVDLYVCGSPEPVRTLTLPAP
ncbi:hypothetical protein [Nocardioides astragali]|uniref:DUF1707 domain-containing protein n=1 Tax=Nocardioides astragali TaxID=1776736 RepID=A0ABW2MZ85_9ACTN|nr:hypothetical protein [Nocardioides astragali]